MSGPEGVVSVVWQQEQEFRSKTYLANTVFLRTSETNSGGFTRQPASTLLLTNPVFLVNLPPLYFYLIENPIAL